MKRIVSLWCKTFALDRLAWEARRHQKARNDTHALKQAPFALVRKDTHGLRLVALNEAAWASGLQEGMRLTDALALQPALTTQQENPPADAKFLRQIADWCQRYTPIVGLDGTDSLWLDITGAAHLYGGEEALLHDLNSKLTRLGFTNALGLAETPGAAWAVARFSKELTEKSAPQTYIIAPGSTLSALTPLPIDALRLDEKTRHMLKRFGLKTIGALCAIPRANLKRRFPQKEMREAVLHRLDQLFGTIREPIIALCPEPAYAERLSFADPILATESFRQGLKDLLSRLCQRLEDDRKGAIRLTFSAYHADGDVSRVTIATARPSRHIDHMLLLFRDRLEKLNPGFGVDQLTLSADQVLNLETEQLGLEKDGSLNEGDAALTRLVDRLSNRLGANRVYQMAARASHIPEHATARIPAISAKPLETTHPSHQPARPIRLLSRPEPIEVIAEVPEGPPLRFTWRRVSHRVARSEGPERIAPEWWKNHTTTHRQPQNRTRDYYRVEDTEGRRFWLYREGLYRDLAHDETAPHPRWHMHGLFT